ncbi:MAG: lytic transglycosylase domain-containing protein [Turneriella sp.]
MKTALLGLLCLACAKSTVTGAVPGGYAKLDTSDNNGYLAFYTQGLKLNTKSQNTGKMRAYLLSSMLKPDLKNSCAQWDCVAGAMKALPENGRSPLYAYALYHLAELAFGQGALNEALSLCDIPASAPQPLQRKISLLRGRILQLNPAAGAAQAAAHFRAHAEKFTDAESLYFAAAAIERAGEKEAALPLAIKALERPEVDHAFSQSGVLVRNILNKGIYTIEDAATRIRLMEALRIAKDRASALKLFQSLWGKKLSGAESLLFVHYGSRFLIDRNDWTSLPPLISTNEKDFLSDGNEKAALDICERLLKKKQATLARRLFAAEPATKPRLQCQLRAFQRGTDKIDQQTKELSGRYLKDHDGESTLAERLYLRSCLPGVRSKSAEWDIDCLEELRRLTRGKPTGGAARYFLARHYDAARSTDKVTELLKEIAADYADDFYFYRLIEKPLSMQRQLAQGFRAGSSRNERVLDALLHADLTRARDIQPLPQLKDLEAETQKLSHKPDELRSTAMYLFAADSRDEARELLKADDGYSSAGERKLTVYRTLIALGAAADKSDIALFGVKQWLREKKLRPFIYEIPPGLLALLYPTTFSAHVQKYAPPAGVEHAEVFALIRQESQFFPGAISVAKAQGLMQLLPSTAKLVAAKQGLRKYNLLTAEDNIRLGIGFMRDIKDHYSADYMGLAIAYNAGPGRYTQWKAKYSEDDDIFIEEIPFQETYHYVRVLLADRVKYRALLTTPQ